MHRSAEAVHKALRPVSKRSAGRSGRVAARVRTAGAVDRSGCASVRVVASVDSWARAFTWAVAACVAACGAAHIIILSYVTVSCMYLT